MLQTPTKTLQYQDSVHNIVGNYPQTDNDFLPQHLFDEKSMPLPLPFRDPFPSSPLLLPRNFTKRPVIIYFHRHDPCLCGVLVLDDVQILQMSSDKNGI